jgi:hypothetical protein
MLRQFSERRKGRGAFQIAHYQEIPESVGIALRAGS